MGLPNFTALRDLHNSANDLLDSPELIQKVTVGGRKTHESKWLYQASEASLRMLDVCGVSKDVLSLVKEHLLDLQFTLRGRALSRNDIESKFLAYSDCRKKLRKETLKCLKSLKGMMKESNNHQLAVDFCDEDLAVVAEVLREVRGSSVSIVESLLSLISIPWLDDRSGKTASFAGKLMRRRKGRVGDFCDETALQTANKRLEAVEIAIEDLGSELECMFRRLIQTRASLLNILTN
ncbi:unnamed protein product [Linum tenue]|uniref:Uncharacterized protein n=1 Tax=Linum tenue TaxID=586396 RepID=A0AAV0LLI6_9ROSI|nr:unnamed protein product [Linum tenue]